MSHRNGARIHACDRAAEGDVARHGGPHALRPHVFLLSRGADADPHIRVVPPAVAASDHLSGGDPRRGRAVAARDSDRVVVQLRIGRVLRAAALNGVRLADHHRRWRGCASPWTRHRAARVDAKVWDMPAGVMAFAMTPFALGACGAGHQLVKGPRIRVAPWRVRLVGECPAQPCARLRDLELQDEPVGIRNELNPVDHGQPAIRRVDGRVAGVLLLVLLRVGVLHGGSSGLSLRHRLRHRLHGRGDRLDRGRARQRLRRALRRLYLRADVRLDLYGPEAAGDFDLRLRADVR